MIQPEQIEIPQDPSSTDVITHTLRLLRRIRGVTEGSSFGSPPWSLEQRRRFLIDAERVGSACASFLIAPPGESMVEERDVWYKMMVELSPGYSNRREVTYMGDSLEGSTQRVHGKLRLLAHIITDSRMQEEFQRYFRDWGENKLSLEDILDNRRIVFSPLSTDYLTAALLHRFAEVYLASECFRLKPIIFDRNLRLAVAITDYVEDFDAIKRIGVFVECSTSGGTLRATWRAIPDY